MDELTVKVLVLDEKVIKAGSKAEPLDSFAIYVKDPHPVTELLKELKEKVVDEAVS
jgi:hypothetical protein